MLQPRKPLDLSSANAILEKERKPLDLSSANAILKKKEQSESNMVSNSGNGSLDSSEGKKPKFRLPNDNDFVEMQNRGIAPPDSEIKYYKSNVPDNLDDLYDLNQDGTQKPKPKPKSVTQTHWNDFNRKPYKIASIESNNKDAKAIPKETKFRLPDGYAQKPTADNPKLTEELYNFTENDKKQLKKDIDKKISDNDLNLDNPYLYYSTFNKQSKLNPKTNQYEPVQKDNFIEKTFGENKLAEIGINVADFDGFLNKKGYKDEFLDKEEKGLFTQTESGIGKESYNIVLAKEREKKRLLSLYMGEMDGRGLAKRKLQYEKDNLDKNSNDAINIDEITPYTQFDSKILENYVKTEMPNLSKKISEVEADNKQIYAKHKAGETNLLYGTERFFKKAGYGFIDKVNQIATTIYDKIGADERAQGLRFLNEERQLSRPNTRDVGYAKGLTTQKDGTNYLFTEEGRIIDQNLKIDVTDLLQEYEYNYIKFSAKEENKSDFTFSPQGSIIQFGGVAGDMIVQLALTKNLSNVVPSLSKIPLTKSASSSIIVQTALGYTQGASETYKMAIDAGINEKEARIIADDAGQNMALLYGATSPMSLQTKATQALFGSEGKELIKKAVNAYVQTGKKGFLETLKIGLKTIPRNAAEWAEEGIIKEFPQELTQQTGEAYLVNAKINERSGKQLAKETITANEVVNTLIQTTLSGGLAVVPKMFSRTDKLSAYATLSKDSNFEKDINSLVNSGVVTNEQANVLKKDVNIFKNQVSKIPKNLSKNIAMDVMSDLQDISDLESKKKGLDKSFHEEIDVEIEAKRNSIREKIKSTETKKSIIDAEAKPQEVAVTETKLQAEVPQQAEAEKVATPPVEDVVPPSVSKEEYADFIDNNNVSDERLNSIADKVKNQEKLSEQENAIFVGKTSEINKIIADAGKEDGNIVANGNVQSRTSNVGESGTAVENNTGKETLQVGSVGVGGDVKLGNNTIIVDMSLPFDSGVNTGLVKNSKGAVYHDKNTAKLEKLGYSKEQIDNLSQTELNEILAKNIENPNVATSAKLPIAEEQITTDDIADFINQTYLNDGKQETKPGETNPTAESNKGTSENSVQENPSVSKGAKKGKQKEIKLDKNGYVIISKKGKTPLNQRKFKGDRKEAASIEPTDVQSLVLSYFANGGKIASAFFSSKGELKARNNGFNGIATKNAQGINAIAHLLWESQQNKTLKLDTEEIKDAIENVVNSHNNVNDIVSTLLKNYELKEQEYPQDIIDYHQAIQEAQNEENANEEEAQEVFSSLDQLSEAEIIELAESQDKSYEDYLKDLEKRQVTYDLGPFSEQGTIQPDGWILSENGDLLSPESVSNVKQVNPDVETKKPISKDTPELKEVNEKLIKANENLRIAKDALARKAKSLDKELVKDNEDIFGERKNQNENKLFDERVDGNARNKATEKERKAIKDAQDEIKALTEAKAKIESGEIVSTKEMDFDAKQQLKDKVNAEIDTDLVSKEYYEKFQKDFPNTLLAIEENNGLITIFEDGKSREIEGHKFFEELKKSIEKGYKGIAKVSRKAIESESKKTTKKPTTTKEQRINIANAKVDDIANALKGIDNIFGFKIKVDDIEGLNKNGIDIVDVIADVVKQAVAAGIEIDVAISKIIAHFKETIDFDVNIDDIKKRVSLQAEPAQSSKKQTKKPIDKNAIDKDSFEFLANTMPASGVFGNFLSGETIEKVTGEATDTNQSYEKIKLQEAFAHGKNIIARAKEQFGDNYVSKILEYVDGFQLDPANVALIYNSIENDLRDLKLANPSDITIKKQFDLVQLKGQNYSKSIGQAMNMPKLRNMQYYGYDTSETTDLVYNEQELKAKKSIQSALESNADAINNEAELQENEEEISIEEVNIPTPTRKRNSNIVKKELADVWKNMLADVKKASQVGANDLRQNSFSPISDKQIKAAAPHILKATKLLAELGGLTSKQIVDEIYKNIKEAFPNINRKDVIDVINSNGYVAKKNTKIADIVKTALIDAGFGREITVTKKDENGNKVKEKRKVLDWKQLAGEEGSIDNIKKNVEETLKKQGYTNADIANIQQDLIVEYTNLRASIVEKSLNELQNRNTSSKVNVKAVSQRMAELYNFGLFEEQDIAKYNKLLNSLLGLNDFDQKTFEKLTEQAKAFRDLYASGLDKLFIQPKIDEIQKQVNTITFNFAFKNGGGNFKAVTVTQEFMGLSQRMMLHSLGQMIQNTLSGFTQNIYSKTGNVFIGNSTKALRKQASFVGANIFSDITAAGATSYGNVDSNLASRGQVEDMANNLSKNRNYHRTVSTVFGRAHLEATDSYFKYLLTQRNLVNNLIKILTSDTNPQKMSKKEALRYVSEKLTGQNFEDAKTKALELINNVNTKAKKEIVNTNSESVIRLADSLVKASLVANGKITQEQLTAANEAAYTSAGFDLGHEANNIISKKLGLFNADVSNRLLKAIKEKNWTEATLLKTTQIFTNNIMSKFVGGGTNWITLTVQKIGLNPLSVIPLVIDNARANSLKIDVSEDGVKNLKTALMRKTNAENTNVRIAIGSMITIASYVAWQSLKGGSDDEEDEFDPESEEETNDKARQFKRWLWKNPELKKYFSYMAPTAVAVMIAGENKELAKELGKILGIRGDIFDDGLKTVKATGKIYESVDFDSMEITDQEKFSQAKGDLGKVIGNTVNTPLPWRTVRDIENVVRSVNGQPIFKTDYKAKGFKDGFTKGGFIEYIITNPDKIEEEEEE